MCSILPGHRDGLRTEAVTNRGPGPGLRLESRGRGVLVLLEGVGLGEVRLQQWEGCEVSLGQLMTFLSPSGQSCLPENEGAVEPRG